MTRLRLRVALLLVLASAATATAQTQTPVAAPARSVAAGDKLRITMSDGRTVSATATAMTDTTLQIREGNTTRTMDLTTVSRVERVIPDPIRNGLAWGLLAGGGAGAALGAMAGGCDAQSFCIIGRGESAVIVGILGAGVGAVVGVIGDARTHRMEVIYPAVAARREITLAPMASARVRGVMLSIRW